MTAEHADAVGSVHCRLTELLEERHTTVAELARQIGISAVNLSVLKNDHARAIRFSTLVAICDALDCTIGDLLTIAPAGPEVST